MTTQRKWRCPACGKSVRLRMTSEQHFAVCPERKARAQRALDAAARKVREHGPTDGRFTGGNGPSKDVDR